MTKSHGKKHQRQVMFEKFQPKNYVCDQGQTTIQIQAPTNMEAKWSSDEKLPMSTFAKEKKVKPII
jgi:hypothetical protein